MRSSNLISCLRTFQKAVDDELSKGKLSVSLLGELFLPIARHLICGGHFEVSCGGKIYRHIYPVTVEFYFHVEGKGEGKIKDYIVYHRNKDKTPEEYIEAYPLGSFNTHVSGIDITFEDYIGRRIRERQVSDYTKKAYNAKRKIILKIILTRRLGLSA